MVGITRISGVAVPVPISENDLCRWTVNGNVVVIIVVVVVVVVKYISYLLFTSVFNQKFK